jgi:hypothetical protein
MALIRSTRSHQCSHRGVEIVSFDSGVMNEFTFLNKNESVEEVSCVVGDIQMIAWRMWWLRGDSEGGADKDKAEVRMERRIIALRMG